MLKKELLERIAFGKSDKRMIYGYTVSASQTVSVMLNCTMSWGWYAYNFDVTTTSATTISATSDADGYFELIIPDDFVITSITFNQDSNNASRIKTISMSNLKDVSSLAFLTMCFASLTSLTTVSGFESLSEATALVDMTGLFYQCTSLKSVDISKIYTNGIDKSKDSRSHYGFSGMFYNCNGLMVVSLPYMPSTATVGTSSDRMYNPFYECKSLTTITAKNEIAITYVDTIDCKLSLDSMRSLLQALSPNPVSGSAFQTTDGSWYYATQDTLCPGYIETDTNNGWTFENTTIRYYDPCTTEDHFYEDPKGMYSYGIEEDSAYSSYGNVYAVLDEGTINILHSGYIDYRFDTEEGYIDGSSSFTLDMGLTTFNPLDSSAAGKAGLTRNGVATYNNYYNLFIYLIGTDGSKSSQYMYNNTWTPGTQLKLSVDLSSYAQELTDSKVYSLHISYANPTQNTGSSNSASGSKEPRKKGTWFNYVIVE